MVDTSSYQPHFIPSFPLYQGLDLRYAISIDGKTPVSKSIKVEAETGGAWATGVVYGYTKGEHTYVADSDKEIQVNIHFLDPGLVLTGLKVSYVERSPNDRTHLLKNPDFEYKSEGVVNDGTTVCGCPYGWKTSGQFTGSSWGINSDGSNFSGANLCWINSNPFPSDFRLYQEVKGLEPGTYLLSCRMGIPGKYNNVRLFANQYVTYFGQASDYPSNLTTGEINHFAGYSEHSQNLKDISVTFTIRQGETLKLGVATSNRYGDGTTATNNDGWFKVDDFRLEYGGDPSSIHPLGALSPLGGQERVACYTINGLRTSPAKGINIINQHKILIK